MAIASIDAALIQAILRSVGATFAARSVADEMADGPTGTVPGVVLSGGRVYGLQLGPVFSQPGCGTRPMLLVTGSKKDIN